jgi:hypothetical protein
VGDPLLQPVPAHGLAINTGFVTNGTITPLQTHKCLIPLSFLHLKYVPHDIALSVEACGKEHYEHCKGLPGVGDSGLRKVPINGGF